MIRASYFIYKPNEEIDLILSHLTYAAKKLWNVANYEKRNWTKESNQPFPDWYDQKKRLKTHFWYKNLPSQSAQEVLKVLQEAWNSFFELKKTGGMENPKPPRFKHRNFNVKFLNNGFKVENDSVVRLSIPAQLKTYLREKHGIEKKFVYIPIPKHILLQKVKTVEIKPVSKGEYKVILSQEYETPTVKKNSEKYMAIDIGMANALTCYDYQGRSFILSGRQYLSVERYFHKKIAYYQAISDAQAKAKGVYPKKSKRVLQLYKKKKRQTFHILHCMTRKVIDLAWQQGVETIVIGDLKGIREQANFGKKTNQKLHSFPFQKIVQMLTYKAEEKGISVVTIKEAYTSQTCSVCKPFPAKEYAKKNNRKHRGLYVCEDCKAVINADVNGAMNLAKMYLKGLNAQSVVVLDTPIVYTFNGQQFVGRTRSSSF